MINDLQLLPLICNWQMMDDGAELTFLSDDVLVR
jgi:hypothetical protein